MSDWIKSVIETFSYAGVVFLMFLENVFPPIPSELIMPLAGFFSVASGLSVTGVIVAGTAGSVLGSVPLYFAGRLTGHARLRRWCDRYGKWIGFTGHDLDNSRTWFERHGNKAVLLGRVVPGVRSLISVPAGMSRMNLGVFLSYTTLGSAVWSAALAFAGRALEGNYERVEKIISPISTAIVAGIVLFILYRAIREHRRARR